MVVLFGCSIIFGNSPESLQMVCTNNVNHAATHMDTKAMDLNKQSVLSPPLGNLYETFTKPFFYLSFQDEPLTRIQITCSVNPKLTHTCVYFICMHLRDGWNGMNSHPIKNTSEIDLSVYFTIINLW